MRRRNPRPDMTRIGLTLRPEDALYVSAALRYYIDTIQNEEDGDEINDQYIVPIRGNRRVLARLAKALHARGYGYVDPE